MHVSSQRSRVLHSFSSMRYDRGYYGELTGNVVLEAIDAEFRCACGADVCDEKSAGSTVI